MLTTSGSIITPALSAFNGDVEMGVTSERDRGLTMLEVVCGALGSKVNRYWLSYALVFNRSATKATNK